MAQVDKITRRGLPILCPHRFCHGGVLDIDVEDLKRSGVQALLLDLDNTLVGWQKSDVSDAVRAWLKDLKAAGIKLCLVSNTRHGERLVALSTELDIPYVKRAWKPRKRGFLNALKELGVEASKTIMVGDQMFTDILGGRRVGLLTFMVKPLEHREFPGTKVTRVFEKALLAYFRKSGQLK